MNKLKLLSTSIIAAAVAGLSIDAAAPVRGSRTKVLTKKIRKARARNRVALASRREQRRAVKGK